MEINEAYDILGVSEDISDEDLKKIYKKLAVKWHPDVSKNPDKFKQINEAHQLIVDYRANPHKYQSPQEGGGFWGNVVNLGDILFGGNGPDFFRQDQPFQAPPINVQLNLSFQEAVLGCEKNLTYSRNKKCDTCGGEGSKRIGNSCKECNGFGQKTVRQGNTIMQTRCNTCKGANVKQEECKTCKGKRTVKEERDGMINVPAGVQNGHILRMQNEGHFMGKSFMFDTYGEIHIKINVAPHKTMTMQDKNVCSTIHLSLLEALQGKTVSVETIFGNKDIVVPPKARNAEFVEIPGCGVGKVGKHIVFFDVFYPEDIVKLIKDLNGNTN